MRVYDVLTEWEECKKNIDAFLDSHRIEPYTQEEIDELSGRIRKEPNACTLAVKAEEAPKQEG